MLGIHCCQCITLLRELMEYIYVIYEKVESFNSYTVKFKLMPAFGYINE